MERHRPHPGAWLLLVLGLGLAAFAQAHERERLVIFGDSLSDPGNAFVLTMNVSLPPFELIPSAPYALGGMHFTNGKTWAEQLAERLDAERSARPALLKPLQFTNYAVGGARARGAGPFDLGTQVDLFLHHFNGQAPGDALYVLAFGGNDVRDALAALATDPSGATSSAILQSALGAMQANVARLAAAGAREFLVLNAPDLGLVPAVRLLGPGAQGAARWLAATYNGYLSALLDGAQGVGLAVARVDLFLLLNEVAAAPAAFGFTNATDPCIVPGVTAQPYCQRPNQYLFWDGIHPTRAGHRVMAERAATALGLAARPLDASDDHPLPRPDF